MLKLTKRKKFLIKKKNKKSYTIDNAIVLVKNCSISKFNESIDVYIHLGIDPKKSDQIIRGFTVLPFGTGKLIRILVFAEGEEADKALKAGANFVGMKDLVEKIKFKKIFFDIVVATPKSMFILNSLVKILGPKGLMPNYKFGTLTSDVFNTVRNIRLGQIKYKNDKSGIVSVSIGKSNFNNSDLKSNFFALLKSLNKIKPISSKGTYFRKIWLSSTMGLAFKINQKSFDFKF